MILPAGGAAISVPMRVGWRRGDGPGALVAREWIVTNGLGGYASGTVAGVLTRRFHGLLVAALPAPLGRTMMLNRLDDTLRAPDGVLVRLSGEERHQPDGAPHLLLPDADVLAEMRLEAGLPVWRFERAGVVLEKRLLLPHLQNTVHVIYRLLEAPAPLALLLRPAFNVRPHEGRLDAAPNAAGFPYPLVSTERGLELDPGGGLPRLRLALRGGGGESALVLRDESIDLHYRIEASRGYDSRGPLHSPGHWEVALPPGAEMTLVASTESWDVVDALPSPELLRADAARRLGLLGQAHPAVAAGAGAELVLAADQFIMTPHTRVTDEARLHAEGNEARSVIAGYPWFTDWGRDTMISLEGLTLLTGRPREARYILQTFSDYVRDGLIPNMFPEGENEGLYHTADATLWFFHALARYETLSGDYQTRRYLMPKLGDIIDRHVAGTRFGIGVDPTDGLLRQGAPGYQLTWMDALVAGWVVTPRRGKAVEINALFYNALCLMEGWARADGDARAADRYGALAARARDSFNRRFWCEARGHLHDVIDGDVADSDGDVADSDGEVPGGDDASLRPNQIFAVSLPHAVLDPARWPAVVSVVRERLLTPFGLRSLAPGHGDYRAVYDGDLRSRDAAYHQGTVWAWLIGPFIDAWLKVHPDDRAGARRVVEGLLPHLGDACLGTVSEIFDAEAPFTARGCIAQAWSVAEALRALVATAPPDEQRRARSGDLI